MQQNKHVTAFAPPPILSFSNNMKSKLRSESPSTSTNSSQGDTASPRPSAAVTSGTATSKLNYDMPLDEILDDSFDELDADMEICMKIGEFLKDELGKEAVADNVPIYLTNNIKNLGIVGNHLLYYTIFN